MKRMDCLRDNMPLLTEYRALIDVIDDINENKQTVMPKKSILFSRHSLHHFCYDHFLMDHCDLSSFLEPKTVMDILCVAVAEKPQDPKDFLTNVISYTFNIFL